MPNALAGAWVQMCPVSPCVFAHGVGGGCPRVEMRHIAYGMKELPIGEKRAQQKKPRPPQDGGFVNQGEGEHQEVCDDPINCHVTEAYLVVIGLSVMTSFYASSTMKWPVSG